MRNLLEQLSIDSVGEFAQFALTVGLGVTVCAMTWREKVPPEALMTAFSMMVGFWFGKRQGGNGANGH